MRDVEEIEAAEWVRPRSKLRRSLRLSHAVLYGLGVTIGAGIYALVGETAARSGMQAPLAFVFAALVMAPSAASFAELATRLPFSAGEATYVRYSFGSRSLGFLVGLLTVAMSIISASAVCRGSAGYIQVYIPFSLEIIAVAVAGLMGLIAAWGIKESVTFAGIMTLIEIGGLIVIISAGALILPDIFIRIPEAIPATSSADPWIGILGASLLAFFAFTGFEGLANIAEEVKQPQRILPAAIFLTLTIVTLLYVAVVWVALIAVPMVELGTSAAPLSLVYERVTNTPPFMITNIAIIATLNGIIVFMVMASRVIYGMAAQGLLPSILAVVNERTRTPLLATMIAAVLIGIFAAVFPIEELAETASRITLTIFVFVNAALVNLKLKGMRPPADAFVIPAAIPVAGLLTSLAMLIADVLS
jgi:basic amino acid/polyamine antiporter, APA family